MGWRASGFAGGLHAGQTHSRAICIRHFLLMANGKKDETMTLVAQVPLKKYHVRSRPGNGKLLRPKSFSVEG